MASDLRIKWAEIISGHRRSEWILRIKTSMESMKKWIALYFVINNLLCRR